MQKFFSIFLIVPLYFIAMLFLFILSFAQEETESLEHIRLSKAINYSTDAAVAEMLRTGDLGMDYVDQNKMVVDPSLALDCFVDMFALNYGLPLTDENREMIRTNFMPIFVVTSYDGYYVYEQRRLNVEGDYDLIATPKIPYTYRAPDDSLYALNFGFENCIKLADGKLSKVPYPISKEEAMRVINTKVSDDMLYKVDQAYDQGFVSTFYIPHEMTSVSHNNAIEGPSVLAFIEGLNLTTRNKISEFSIGGAKVEQARMIAGYRRNGINYYCYADLLPAGTPVAEMFTDVVEAAKAGFHHDSLFMN